MSGVQKPRTPENPARILVVDDEPRLRDVLAALLTSKGFQVSTACDGADALRILETHSFDLVLLDLVMPRLTGHQVMDEIRDRQLSVKVIVVSGDASMESAISALRRGAYDFVRKPYEPDELLKRVDNALESQRLERANQEMERRLRRSERLHRYLINSSPDLIYTLDTTGRFTFINDAVAAMLGYTRQELVGQHFSVIVHPDDSSRVHRLFSERRTGKRSSRGIETRLKRKDSGPAPYIVTEFNAMGMYDGDEKSSRQFLGTYGVVRDIGDRKRAEEAVAFQAYHDLLTGLPNRVLMLDRLAQAMSQAKRGSTQVAVMFLDLDNFKLVNDSLGHMAGDKLLQAIAARLKSCLREVDTSARLGGDEFVLLLPQVNGEGDTAMIAEKILHALEQKFVIGENEVYASVSIGIALYPVDGETPESLIKNADVAMYHAKSSGRNSYEFYRQVMEVPASGRLSLVRDLREALDRDELDVFYHPQVEISTGRILGLEALLRWHHPQRGLLMPCDFFKLAEESGLLGPIGEWVLRRVCTDMVAWRTRGLNPGRVAINLAPQQIEKDRSDEKFLKVLEDNDVAPEQIGIEITESAVMKYLDRTVPKLKRLRDAGVEVSLDDFGTGYSSLGYLQRLPIDVIKVDQCFVREMTQHPGHASILRAMTAMAEGLQLRLLIEGVETSDQLELLERLGCKEYQGFLFSEPLDRERTLEVLSAQAGCGHDKTGTADPLPA